MNFEVQTFLWYITISVLLIYGVISLALFGTNHKKVFLYYAIYLLLLFVFVFDKSPYDELTTPYTVFTETLNWYIQISLTSVYFWFSFEFLNYFKHYPKQKKPFKNFIILVFLVSTILFIYANIWKNPDFYTLYFSRIYAPLIVAGFLFIIYNISRKKEPMNRFYLPGMILYIIFCLLSLYFSINAKPDDGFAPISYLFIGILIESTMFSVGLGYHLKIFFDRTLSVEKELNLTQKKLHTKLQKQLDKKQLENTNNELKISSLQAQMNSHFTFNILNSLKSFIIENDKETAVNFLNKFSKLIREYLEGSQLEINNLADELRTVELYLEIENIRLNNTLNYQIIVENNINLNAYFIPTHLLIPFVEKSIWKGLFQNKGSKELQILISEENDSLLIEINDNGKYDKINNSDRNQNIKDTLKLIDSRIDIFNKTHDTYMYYDTVYEENAGHITIVIPSIEEENVLKPQL